MSWRSTTTAREPTFELRKGSGTLTPTEVKPDRVERTSREKSIDGRHNRIASRITVWALFCACVISSLLFLPRAHALDPTRLISQYGHSVWRVQDGVVCANTPFAQTTDGYIWMAGIDRESLIRFDGSQFSSLRPPKDKPFPGKITFLLGAHDGSLWIGTRTGLSRLKDGQFSTYTKSSDKFGISAMIEDHAGKVWLTRYHVPKGEGALCVVLDQGLRCYGRSNGVPATYGLGLVEDATDNLWFAGENLYRWKPGTEAKQYFNSAKHPQLFDVASDNSGNVWAAMDEVGPKFGVRYLRNGIWGEYVAAGFRSSTIRASGLFLDRAGAVWIATQEDGLYRVWNNNVDHFSRTDGLSGHEVAYLFEDHEGNFWVSTDGGVDLFRNTPVTTYSMDQGLSSGDLTTVLASIDGTIWAGEADNVGGAGAKFADILQAGPDQLFSKGPILPGRIGAMFQDHSGALWFALDTGKMVVYDHGRVEKVLTRDGHVLEEGIRTIFEDRSQTILALTKTKLLRIIDRRVQDAIEIPKPLSGEGYLLTNPSGGIWIVGHREGVMLYQNDVIQAQPSPTSAKPFTVNGVVADGSDPLILATSEGLFRWNGPRWNVLNDTDGLPCNRLLGAIKDRHGALWLPANCGLLRIEALELQKWRENPESRPSFTVFDPLDGARPPGRGSEIQPTMSLGPDGRVWYATGGVIQMIDPDHTYKNGVSPPVHVDQLIADSRPFQPAGQPRIPPNTHNLEIDYTAPSFSVPQKVQFRYFLEGHDKNWQGPVTRHQAFYTDLPPGNYRFHVVACNNSGVWNDIGAVAAFNVEPAFYQTVWFKALMAIAVVGVLWALYLLRLKQATAHVQERLLGQMEERERIARELHDTLLQGFQGITLRMQGVSKNMPAQDPLRRMMDEVLDRGDEVLREARQRVRNLRRRTTDVDELSNRLTRCGQELSKDHVATFTLAVVGESKVLESTVEDEAYRIVGEALTNAFRHASASRIETEVTYESSELRIRVRDDGVGIDGAGSSNGRPDHWGLTGMRERAEAIRARLNIWSRESAGTEVELVIPASIAYPRDHTKA
jgi:signal transduction histidine kinase/ligand-binding sensor domain-containing protein